MTTIPASPATAPPLLSALLHDFAQKALTAGAVALAAHGVIAASQEDQLVQIGLSIGLFAFSCAWTFVAAKLRTQRLAAALASNPATPKGAN